MNERPSRQQFISVREALKVRCLVCVCITLSVCLLLFPLLVLAQSSFTNYTDVQQVLASLADILPSELKSSVTSSQQTAWQDWVLDHDRDIRKRLLRGDEDTIVNWLLFGTSFTQQARTFFNAPLTPDVLRAQIAQRTKDFISALSSPGADERADFARQLVLSQGYGFNTAEEQAALQRYLYAQVDRVVAERQQFKLREDALQADDVVGQIVGQSSLFRDRGLSLDTSILASFAIERALETMKNQGLLAPNGIRRVAVIGPGLD